MRTRYGNSTWTNHIRPAVKPLDYDLNNIIFNAHMTFETLSMLFQTPHANKEPLNGAETCQLN